MKAKIKWYLTIWSVIIITVVASTGILINSKYNDKFILSDDEIKTWSALTWVIKETKENFVDTEKEVAPEIMVEEEYVEMMPKVEETVEKHEIDKEKHVKEPPKEINLKVPFFPQAPDADWSLPWKEACEEASISLAYHFVHWDNLTKEEFKEDILWMVELQKNLFWKYVDTSIKETAKLLEEYYWYSNYEIIKNPSIEDIKKELALWHPIIAPFAWKELGNSFFTNGWPRYHMLVIVGYNDSFFLTNDVWTSRWENFTYSYETIMESMHDLVPEWEGDILNWEKVVLVLK